MSGRGGINNVTWDGVVPPQCQPNPAILRLISGLNWVEASEPLHKDIDVNVTCGVGPGMVFANTVLNKKDSSIGGVVGLVPCAIGGTKISEWGRGTHLYNQLVSRASAALQDSGSIQALLWYQGEMLFQPTCMKNVGRQPTKSSLAATNHSKGQEWRLPKSRMKALPPTPFVYK
ncbi:hypothetical protein CsSME_00046906 [Camellia sinensis var. sinensis]